MKFGEVGRTDIDFTEYCDFEMIERVIIDSFKVLFSLKEYEDLGYEYDGALMHLKVSKANLIQFENLEKKINDAGSNTQPDMIHPVHSGWKGTVGYTNSIIKDHLKMLGKIIRKMIESHILALPPSFSIDSKPAFKRNIAPLDYSTLNSFELELAKYRFILVLNTINMMYQSLSNLPIDMINVDPELNFKEDIKSFYERENEIELNPAYDSEKKDTAKDKPTQSE